MVDADFIPIQSLDLEAETKITFDLYVNLPLNNKYVLYRRAGGHLEAHQLEALSSRNVGNFYIQKRDYNEFVRYVAGRIRLLITHGAVEQRDKEMMRAAARSLLTSTFDQKDPVVASVLLSNLNDITAYMIESILETSDEYNKKTFQNLQALAAKGTDFQRHPVNVASLAVMIAFGMGYSSARTLKDMAMAGLLHDVGLAKLPPKLIMAGHNMAGLSPEEKEELQTHPALSLAVLKEKGIKVSEVTQNLILQHHEDYGGTGYPRRLRGYALNEFTQIFRVAEEVEALFSQDFTGSLSLKHALTDTLFRLHRQKIIEPTLLTRIRSVLL